MASLQEILLPNPPEITFTEEEAIHAAENEHWRWMHDNYTWRSKKNLLQLFGIQQPKTTPQSTKLERIKDIDIHDIITQYAQPMLVRETECMAKCPFHDDRQASFSYNRKKGVWVCFGCGEKGDAIQFVMRAEKVSFKEAVKLLNAVL